MFNKRLLFFVLASISFIFTLSAYATENLFYRGMRPMSMGGAFTAIADDEYGRNWNPAGMMFLPGMNLSFQLYGRGTQDTINMVTDSIDLAKEIQKPANKGKELTLPETQTLLNNFAGNKIGLRIGADLDMVLPKIRKKKMTFGFGAYADAKSNLWIREQGLPIGFPLGLVNDQVLYEITADIVPSFSGAYRFENVVPTFDKGGKRDLSVGLTVKYVNRIKASNEKNPYTFQELFNGYRGNDSTQTIDFAKDIDLDTRGSSIGFDIGALTSLTDYLRLGMTIHDIGGTNISYNTTSITNDKIPMNVRIGTALYPLKYLRPDSQNKFFNVILSADLDNLNGDSGRSSSLSDKLHLGAEMQFSLFKNFLFVQLRGGSNQGFPTYGVTLHGLWIFQLDYTVYGDEFADYQNAAFSIVF
ncbi:MAG: hypothetical protein PHX78_08735 [bacterium]|nr:hypothetical protein [bacterium]